MNPDDMSGILADVTNGFTAYDGAIFETFNALASFVKIVSATGTASSGFTDVVHFWLGGIITLKGTLGRPMRTLKGVGT